MSLNTILATTPLTSTGYHLKATGTTIGNSLIWDNGTNVGIGNTNTSYTLDVTGTARFTGALTAAGLTLTTAGSTSAVISGTGTNVYSSLSLTNTTTGYGYDIGFGGSASIAPNSFYIYGGSSASVKFLINSSGNVGIGTSSTGFNASGLPLVVGSGSGNTGLTIFSGNTFSGSIHFADAETTGAGSYAGFINYDHTGNSMQFGTTGATPTERMRITSGGNVLIGTTTDSGQALRVDAAKVNTYLLTTTNNDVLRVQNNSASLNGSAVLLLQTTGIGAGTTSYYIYGELSGGSNTFRVYNNGNVQNTNNSYTALSDIKLKENIIDTAPKLEDLLKIRIVNYNLKAPYETHKQIGIIAQELEQIFPNLVEETQDKDANTTTKSVKYSVFVPILIKAIQEMNTKIIQLEKLVATK